MNKLKKRLEWLINHVPESVMWEVCEEFKMFHGRVMTLYASYPPDTTTSHTHTLLPLQRDTATSICAPPRIDLIENHADSHQKL